jgi:hypothetical protein
MRRVPLPCPGFFPSGPEIPDVKTTIAPARPPIQGFGFWLKNVHFHDVKYDNIAWLHMGGRAGDKCDRQNKKS